MHDPIRIKNYERFIEMLQRILLGNRTNLFELKNKKTSTSCPNQMAINIFEYVRDTLKQENSY
jgi:hypothetical protein